MARDTQRDAAAIESLLENWLETEFSFLHVDGVARALAGLPRADQEFMLGWTRRIATTNIQIAYEFISQALAALQHLDHHLIEAWALHAMDTYDRSGLQPALRVIREVEGFVHLRHAHTAGAVFEEVGGVLLTFLHGLSGRRLKLASAASVYTDSETLYLPPVVAQLPTTEDNFRLAKSMLALLWAQTRFGTFRVDFIQVFEAYPDPAHALAQFHALETLRLEACLSRELPGLYRQMRELRAASGQADWPPPGWAAFAAALAHPEADVRLSLELLARVYPQPLPAAPCYQGELRPAEILKCMQARVDKEKILLRVKLGQLAEEAREKRERPAAAERPAEFALRDPDADGVTRLELTLDGAPVVPPAEVKQLLTSIYLDFGEIPPEYLVAAGPGEYDPALYQDRPSDPDEVWQGTYHEEGAELYPEWDYGRQHYRKNWCTMREKDVPPVYDEFVFETLQKYSGQVKHLRQTFEAMRDEDRLLKRQTHGDGVDIDALVEALADARDGSEMSERLFTRMHRAERNIAVAFMVDMSGSTRGWINDAERESLVLLCEALETLGDRYAIYGFSGMTRKRCELYRVKRMDEPYNAEVRARISGIRPQDYTRMGFAVRHLNQLLKNVEARTKILITLSDGKPDDYNDYRGEYGIEDTRRALIESRRAGIHPYCITIDEKARDYLPHLYGPAAFTVVDDVRQLPFKVSDIYRRLTT